MTARTVLEVMASGERGGGATHLLDLVGGLPARGFRPIVAIDPAGPTLERVRALGIEAIGLPFMRGRLRPRPILALRRAIAERAPSLVHAHGTRAAFALAMLAALGTLPPLVYTEHGLATDVERGRVARALARLGEAVALRRAALVIALSDYSRRMIIDIDPRLESRVRVVPNAVAPHHPVRAREDVRRALALPPGAAVVGSVMRFVPQKAPLDWIAMAADLARAHPAARFLLVGDGPLRAKAEAAARAAIPPAGDGGSRIAFTGARTDVPDLLGAMDVFVLASRWEGLPIAALEAMAAGLPVVATDAGGVGSAVRDGETGRLVPPADPAALARAVGELLADPGRRMALGAAGLARVRAEHTVERMLERVTGVYAELLPRASGGGA